MYENNPGIKPITMESDTLSALKADMDGIINKTIKTMQMSQCADATISVKLKISLEKQSVANERQLRAAVVPKFEHDVQSVVQTKDKKSGSMSGEYELIYDPENDCWMMRDMRSQISIFDKEAQPVYAANAVDENGNQICIGAGEAVDNDEPEAPENDPYEYDEADDAQENSEEEEQTESGDDDYYADEDFEDQPEDQFPEEDQIGDEE